ncbi:hypothetical protein BCD67_18585 [Oscillatoriales cyanobacterium USR001]|nr:hypothetical protein BCD67_18585 [Oscillatoriales cyanobacterium USR001]
MTTPQKFYIIKQSTGHCEIVPSEQIEQKENPTILENLEKWGPYNSQQEAIARRIGLIRAGKCQPQ